MDIPVIDIHTHLGDVLNSDGGEIIENGAVKKNILFDPISFFEKNLWRKLRVPKIVIDQIVRAGTARSATATRANLRKEMNRNGVCKSIVLPVPPNVTFSQLLAAHIKDPDLLPFTGADFSKLDEVDGQLAEDVALGAMGLKLHPILQRVSLDSPETRQVVECFAPYNRPIIFHAGVENYYLDPQKQHLQRPEFGSIAHAAKLVADFPNVKFIVGHAGLSNIDEVIELMGSFKNVWVDISFQNLDYVRLLINTFGPERVMYGSDWPWGNMFVSIKIIEEIAKNDKGLMRCLLHDNAAELLQVKPYFIDAQMVDLPASSTLV